MEIKRLFFSIVGLIAWFMIVALFFHGMSTSNQSTRMTYPEMQQDPRIGGPSIGSPRNCGPNIGGPTIGSPNVRENVNNSILIKKFAEDLIKLSRQIKKAKLHVRGTKTGDALISAEQTASAMLKSLNLDYVTVVKRRAKKAVNICPEVYNGTRIGYPYFDTGFVVKQCNYSKSLSDLLTILIVYKSSHTFDIKELLRSIRQYHSSIPVIIATMTSKINEKLISSFKNVKIVNTFENSDTIGIAWNKLITEVRTKYTLVARDVIWFNFDARLDRLIRQIERLNVSSAGGAFRDVKGNWIKGCQQRVLRNFTLVYEAGYDESYEACVFCDHIDGPFVITTDLLQSKKFNAKISKQGLFEDFFLRMSSTEHIICPDAMFYTNITERSYNAGDWQSFLTAWLVQKIRFSGREILMPTPKSYPCYTGKGTALSPWCHKENADLVNAAMKVCKDVGVLCEIDSGTIMGSIKFHSVLPWEKDADVSFLTLNFTALKNAKPIWAKMGYRASIQNTVKCCFRNTSRPYHGYIGLGSKHWRLELWGMAKLPSEPQEMHYQPPTMLQLDVQRVRAPRNPGLWARNRYGKNIYQHAQHYTDAGDHKYRKKQFLRCAKPGYQACLDRYNPDGNLQFRDPIP